MEDIISIRGDRDLWLDFTHKIKKQKKKGRETVWKVLNLFIKDYLKKK